MKGFNVVLAVLIFLLAVVSAVFSFFLFEKRSQLIDNYAKLSDQIAQTATVLDKNTKTGVSGKVTADAFSHNQSNNLPTALKNFDNLAREVVTERDDLAAALVDIAVTLGNNQFSAADFQDYSKYKAKLQDLKDFVAKTKKNHDDAINSVVALARKNSVSADADTLRTDPNAFSEVETAVQRKVNEQNRLIAEYTSVCTDLITQTACGPFNKLSPKASIERVKQKFKDLNGKIRQLNTDLRNARNTISAQNSKITTLNAAINKAKAQIASMQRRIDSLHKNAGVPRNYQPVAPGSRKALDMIRTQTIGKVLVVDEKFGFVTISLGKRTYVIEKRKDGDCPIDPQIPSGAVLIVARNMPSGEAVYINQVKITKLDDFCSIAEAVDKNSGKPIKVGDVVYFSEKEIENIIKNRRK